MKTDARVRYTRMVIKDSFVKLLKDQPINKITVKDVCDLAEINRATFYKHYTDCFDLLKRIEDESIAELQQLVKDSRHKGISDIFNKILSEMKEKGSLYYTLFSENGDSAFPTRILNLCYEQVNPLIEAPDYSLTQQEWLYYFMAYGCSGILTHWVNSGMKEEPSEITKLIEKIHGKILK
jgi:AcrR family transcriptional regulator